MRERTRIRRKAKHQPVQDELLQRNTNQSAFIAESAPSIIEDVLDSPGQTLDVETRAFMEPRLGHDFSQVRVHTDERAVESAQSVNAQAYTVCSDIVFNVGKYEPGTPTGKHLLAHELTHVAQQSGNGNHQGPLTLGAPDSATERTAQESASAIAGNQPLPPRASAPVRGTIQRSVEGEIIGGAIGAVIGMGVGGIVGALAGGIGGAMVGNALTGDARFEAMRQILEKSQTGKEALKIKEDYHAGIKYHEGGGSYWEHDSKSMVLDTTENITESALTFVHEINHAKYDLTGKSADVNALSRDQYVKQMVEEEAEGTVKSIEAQGELQGAGVDVSHASFPLATQYQQAYDEAVNKAKVGNPDISVEEQKRIGREAGKARVTKGFMDGEVTTSNTGEKYADYYGKYWDAVHAPAP